MAAREKAKQNELDATRLAPSAKRSKLTQFINIRNLGKKVNLLLHIWLTMLSQNHCIIQTMLGSISNSLLLEEALSQSNISVAGCDVSTHLIKLLLKKFVLSVKNDVGSTRLYKRIIKLLKEGRKKKFEYRFTGKETK